MKNKEQQLAQHFKLSEFAVSAEFPQLANEIDFTESEIERTRFFCQTVLEPIREIVGPVNITSGKRPTLLNLKVGGHKLSDHLWSPETNAIAADFTCDNIGKAFSWIILNRGLVKMAYFDLDENFIHISGIDSEQYSGVVSITHNTETIYL